MLSHPYFEIVRTYTAMNWIVDAFHTGALPFIVIEGSPGVGKSRSFRPRAVSDCNVLECTTRAFAAYTWLYPREQVDAIALDDTEVLMGQPEGLALLKGLCQTEKVKRVSWNSTAADREGLPRSFDISAKVMLLANSIPRKGSSMAAVLDRGHLYRFEPTAYELHKEILRWGLDGQFPPHVDSEVYAFIGTNLSLIAQPTFRDYTKGTEKRLAGLDWKSWLMGRWGQDPKFIAITQILQQAAAGDPSLATAKQRVRRFEELGLGPRRTYMRQQRAAREQLGLEKLPRAIVKDSGDPHGPLPASSSIVAECSTA